MVSSIKVSSGWLVIKGAVRPPVDSVVRRQRSGSLGLIEEQGFLEDLAVVVGRLGRDGEREGEDEQEPHDGVDEEEWATEDPHQRGSPFQSPILQS